MSILTIDHRLSFESESAFREAVSAQAQEQLSIYQVALGSEFSRLHPMIQKRFGFNSHSGVASIGRGLMSSIRRGRAFTYPFLVCGSWRRIMFPEQGTNVPFQIENYAYRDDLGRETVTWIRKFETKKPRRFDAYMIFSQERNRIVDYLGTHQHLAVDIDLKVAENGGLKLLSGDQRFYEGWLGFNFPMVFSGIADVCEWYDDAIEKYRIRVEITNRTWGLLFGYEGTFDVEWRQVEVNSVPQNLLPVRVEARE